MRNMKFIILITSIFSLFPLNNYSQIWPHTPMIRYGNVVYHKFENQDTFVLNQKSTLIDKEIENRFFDILTDKDSVGITINGQIHYFQQKNRREPKDGKMIPLFYTRRFLNNKNGRIKYLEIKEITDKRILAEATVKNRKGDIFNRKELVELEVDDLKGIFIGPGKTQRSTAYILSWGAGIAAGIYTISR